MNTRTSIVAVFVAGFLAACAGSPGAYRAGGGRQAKSANPPPASHAHVSGSDSSGATSTYRQPAERPGLGTVWGENVSSHVSMKRFVRAVSSPFAAVALHYNDSQGVDAQMHYLGARTLQPVHAYTPHGGISVALVDPYGNVMPGGSTGGRTLIVGRQGSRYNIVLENKTGGRYEVVASVDGLDVIDGRRADLAKRGYIIEPYSSLVIDGFRRSDNVVAAFRFGNVRNSYAARTSGDRNVGVIGVAVFAERGSVWTTDELHRRDTANPFPGDPSYARPPSY